MYYMRLSIGAMVSEFIVLCNVHGLRLFFGAIASRNCGNVAQVPLQGSFGNTNRL